MPSEPADVGKPQGVRGRGRRRPQRGVEVDPGGDGGAHRAGDRGRGPGDGPGCAIRADHPRDAVVFGPELEVRGVLRHGAWVEAAAPAAAD